MPPELNYDRVHYTSLIPAYMKVQEGSFTMNVSGTIGAGAERVFDATTSVEIHKGSFKLFLRQTPVPAGGQADYDANTLISTPPIGVGNHAPYLMVGASVAGNPFVTEIDSIFFVSLGANKIDVQLRILNPYAGTMTLTNTTFTFFYRVYAPTFET